MKVGDRVEIIDDEGWIIFRPGDRGVIAELGGFKDVNVRFGGHHALVGFLKSSLRVISPLEQLAMEAE